MRNIHLAITLAALLVNAASCWALPSLQQVESAVKAGDYAGAETMTREVVAAKPNLPKAHYILAELMAHNKELSQAKDLDPANQGVPYVPEPLVARQPRPIWPGAPDRRRIP